MLQAGGSSQPVAEPSGPVLQGDTEPPGHHLWASVCCGEELNLRKLDHLLLSEDGMGEEDVKGRGDID